MISLPVIAIFGIMGYRDGVIKRIIEILGVFAALVLTARFASALAPWMMDRTGLPESAALLVTWAALFFAGLLLSRLLATVLTKLINLTILGWVNRLGGALVGMVLGMVVASVLLLAISHVPGGESVSARYQESAVGRFIYYAAPNFYQTARKLGGQKADDLWARAMQESREAAEKARQNVEQSAQEAMGR